MPTHPRHQVLGRDAHVGGKGVAGVAKIVEVQAKHAERLHDLTQTETKAPSTGSVAGAATACFSRTGEAAIRANTMLTTMNTHCPKT